MRALKKSDARSAFQRNKSTDLQYLQELLTAFKQHGLNIPLERMELIMEEHHLLREHRSLVNDIANQNGPSHIKTPMSRQKKHERQP